MISAQLAALLGRLTPNVQLQETPRLIVSAFGDGYKQVSPDGLHPIDRKLTLNWDDLAVSDAQALEDLFTASVGVPISFRAPRETLPRRWLVTSWQRTSPSPDGDAMTATFEERIP
jgi:phage-related protein